MPHTPGTTTYTCQKCGWTGDVNGRPRCLRCYAESSRRWRRKHPAKLKEQRKRWRSRKGWEYEVQRKRRQRNNNKETYRADWKRRYEWIASGDVTADGLRRVYERDGGCCVYCGAKVNARLQPRNPRGFDHVIPRSRGGLHTEDNLVVCCGPCNLHRFSAIAKAEGRA